MSPEIAPNERLVVMSDACFRSVPLRGTDFAVRMRTHMIVNRLSRTVLAARASFVGDRIFCKQPSKGSINFNHSFLLPVRAPFLPRCHDVLRRFAAFQAHTPSPKWER